MERKKYTRAGVALRLLCALYCLFIFAVLFVGRRGSQPQFESFELYMRDCFNVIPFVRIYEFCTQIIDGGDYVRMWAIRNMLGNLLLFYPLGIFLPCLFQGMRTLRQNMKISFCTILSVETIQLLLRVGCFDVDDIILNMTGWMLGFLTFSIPVVRQCLKKCFLEEKQY